MRAAVPTVGWPAKGSSRFGVKILMRAVLIAIPRLEDENGFRQVELGGDRLHAGVVQPFGVEDHGERIASQRRLGEHIERLKPARHRENVPKPPAGASSRAGAPRR